MKKMNFAMMGLILLGVQIQAAQACSCSSYPMDPTEAVKSAAAEGLSRGMRAAISKTKIEMIAVYPNLGEKLNLGAFKGSSCEVKGPQGESLFYCAQRRKADFKIELPEYNCRIVVRAKYSVGSVRARVMENACKN